MLPYENQELQNYAGSSLRQAEVSPAIQQVYNSLQQPQASPSLQLVYNSLQQAQASPALQQASKLGSNS